jgi:monoamine oxidase
MDSKKSVLVIGAGISGLACASELLKLDCRVDIVEARSVFGGRINSHRGFN